MLELARAVGISVPPTRLVPIENIKGLPADMGPLTGNALAVERFDRRPGGRRVHMEDFAQVFGMFPDLKYEKRSYANIAGVLWAETGEEGTYEFVRRLVFSVLIGNGDMHLKNWSLLYLDSRTPVLSPAYDFVSTLPYLPNDQLALSFGDSKRLDGITRDQVRRLAEKAGLAVTPLSEIVAETVDRTREVWRGLPERDLLPHDLRKTIDAHLERTATSIEG
ncbi:MAG: HipA domain-containing protein [Myxococcota bacterium]|nr:HipA domain-containing protein [Myxococcota bacterium]